MVFCTFLTFAARYFLNISKGVVVELCYQILVSTAFEGLDQPENCPNIPSFTPALTPTFLNR